MFIISIVIAIIIGYVCRGKLSNLMFLSIRGIYLIFASFFVELVAKVLLKIGIIELGAISYSLHLVTYILLFMMVYQNRRDYKVQLIGLGFLLNGLVIFANDGMMPVGEWALSKLGIPLDTVLQGMYHLITEGTRFKLLADIMPVHLGKVGFILSIGDLLIILGMMLLIIYGMRLSEKCTDECVK